MGVEERLERLEELIYIILEKIEELERLIRGESADLSIAFKLTYLFSLPALEALEASKRLIRSIRSVETRLDPIMMSILEALSTCRELNVSEITNNVRRIRGRASRRIVREKLQRLEEQGLVSNKGSGNRPKYILRTCLQG